MNYNFETVQAIIFDYQTDRNNSQFRELDKRDSVPDVSALYINRPAFFSVPGPTVLVGF